jgi:hypothetical protein
LNAGVHAIFACEAFLPTAAFNSALNVPASTFPPSWISIALQVVAFQDGFAEVRWIRDAGLSGEREPYDLHVRLPGQTMSGESTPACSAE